MDTTCSISESPGTHGAPSDTTLHTVAFAFLALLFALTVFIPGRIPDAPRVALGVCAAAALYGAAVFAASRSRRPHVRAIITASASLLLFAWLFGAMEPFQHILVRGWMDDDLLRVERAVVGFDVSRSTQAFVSKPMTEWLMFAYMIYVPLLPGMAWLCYRSAGTEGMRDYLFTLSAAFAICFLGFIVYPLASPLYHDRSAYTVPLDGWFFTWTSDLLRAHGHYPGGSLPSPHCAAGTVMLAMLYRYQRRLFYVAFPVIVSLYIATVYGRFHYVEDGIAGILTSVTVVKLAPSVVALFERRRMRDIANGLVRFSRLHLPTKGVLQ